MPRKATLHDLLQRAQRAIDRDESFIYDVAAYTGQIVGNVKHMSWFLRQVANRLIHDTAKYAHLDDL